MENPKPSDLSADFLMMAEKLMLAQGQECVFWKAMKDQTSPSVLGRVAKQTSILYSESLGLFANAVVREDLDRNWQVRNPKNTQFSGGQCGWFEGVIRLCHHDDTLSLNGAVSGIG